ncbi:MAG: cation:proton antiporter [Rickettsiaceae bacterium]|nr:cation:proton antiporter [Rickettsiaceae bacterium]
MEHFGVLPSVVVLLSAAIFIVIIFKKLNLSPVLGYLVAGAIIGDHGLKIVLYEQIHIIAEYGVVFLLYAIGLELSFARLSAMRNYVFGLGTLQVIVTSIIISAGISLFDSADGNKAAVIIAGGLALSSTAVVLQVIDDSRRHAAQVSRISLAVLLLQDFAVVPLLVIVPKLASDNLSSLYIEILMSIMKAAIALVSIFAVGRIFFRPMFRLLSTDGESSSSNELFTATTLLIALASAFATEYMGLSLALGAFTAGVLVAETEFQRKAEESIYPFKGLLLGLFFMSVGMTINVIEIYDQISTIISLTVALILTKAAIITGLCIIFGFNTGVAIHAGLMLSQGGEFAFILYNLAIREGIMPESAGKLLLLIVTCSMALTPLLSIIGAKIEHWLDYDPEKSPDNIIVKGTRDLSNHVIIAGFGSVGRMVARFLEAEAVNYVVIEINPDKAKEGEANGFPVFAGDISQATTLAACGADRALAVILAVENYVTQKKSLKKIAKNYPELPIIVRSEDMKNSHELYELGATIIVPSSYETGLQLGGAVLKALGIGEFEIARLKEQFRSGNYVVVAQDEDIVDEF